jgi:flavin-binding protein dodecin
MTYWGLTEWHECGINYRAIHLPWWQVEEILLGHAYEGDEREDLEQLKAAVLEAGAPKWVERVEYDGIEAEGMYLIGGPLVYAEALNQEHHLWELEEQFGTIEHEDTTWYLTQRPYIAGTNELSWDEAVAIGVFKASEVTPELPWYEAVAINIYGDAALVWWTVRDDWKDVEDESDMCQWDTPARVTVL